MDVKQSAEQLALKAWDVIADYRHDPALVTDEIRAEVRTAAFKFSRNAPPGDDWRVTYGRHLAGALLFWFQDESPESFRALELSSREFENLRAQ